MSRGAPRFSRAIVLAALVAGIAPAAAQTGAPVLGPGGVPPLPGVGPNVPGGMGPRIVIPRHIHDRLQELKKTRFILPNIGSCTVYDQPAYRGASKSFSGIRESFAVVFHRGRVPYEAFRHVGTDWDDRISSFRCGDGCMLIGYRDHPASGDSLVSQTSAAKLAKHQDNAISSIYTLCLLPD